MLNSSIENNVQPYWQTALHEQKMQWKSSSKQPNIFVSELPIVSYTIVRGRTTDEAFMSAAHSVLGAPLPSEPMRVVSTLNGAVLWLSPDEWLIIGAYAKRDELVRNLLAATKSIFSQVVDNSGGFTSLRLTGEQHNLVLRHLTPYDIDVLSVGQCAATVMSKASVIIVRTDAEGVLLVVRRSFTDYVWGLVQTAAKPYGLALCEPEKNADVLFSVFF